MKQNELKTVNEVLEAIEPEATQEFTSLKDYRPDGFRNLTAVINGRKNQEGDNLEKQDICIFFDGGTTVTIDSEKQTATDIIEGNEIYLKLFNLLADEFADLNPCKDDETRDIVEVYRELLTELRERRKTS